MKEERKKAPRITGIVAEKEMAEKTNQKRKDSKLYYVERIEYNRPANIAELECGKTTLRTELFADSLVGIV